MTFYTYFLLLVRDVLGLTFGASACVKFLNPKGFHSALVSYRMFPAKITWLLTRIIIPIEVGIFVILIAGIAPFAGAWTVTIFTAIFTAIVCFNLARRISFSCGCFGSDRQVATWLTAWRNGALFLMSGYLLLRASRVIPGGSAPGSFPSVGFALAIATAAAFLGIAFLARSLSLALRSYAVPPQDVVSALEEASNA